jgi:DNA-binding LacI/PurR family transcriptional regulator
VCAGDRAALSGCAAIGSAGLSVPCDVSVIACDVLTDSNASVTLPALTALAPSHGELARAALDLVAGTGAGGRVVVVPPRLIVRGSTEAPCGPA